MKQVAFCGPGILGILYLQMGCTVFTFKGSASCCHIQQEEMVPLTSVKRINRNVFFSVLVALIFIYGMDGI